MFTKPQSTKLSKTTTLTTPTTPANKASHTPLVLSPIKIICLILSITTIFCLVACGNKAQEQQIIEEDQGTETDTTQTQEPEPTPQPTPTPEPTQSPEPEPSPLTDEEYCYASMLKGMIEFPMYYWYVEEEASNNRFAILDFDQDNQKELFVERTSRSLNTGETFKIIEVFRGGKMFCDVFPDAEFYSNGIVFDNNRREYDDITIYQGTDTLAFLIEYDKSLPDETYGEAFPEDQDTDNDGIVYLWIDEESLERTYLSVDERNEKINSLIADAEKLELPWQSITEENINSALNINSVTIDDSLETIPALHGFIAYKTVRAALDIKIDNIEDFIESYHDLNHFEDSLGEILPSAQPIYSDNELSSYEVNFDDIANIAKYGFQQEISLDELIARSGSYIQDIGNNRVNIFVEYSGLVPYCFMKVLEMQEEPDGTQIINGICNYMPGEETEKGDAIEGYRFNLVVSPNPSSNLDGYEIIECNINQITFMLRSIY